jgi:hypothetical protein
VDIRREGLVGARAGTRPSGPLETPLRPRVGLDPLNARPRVGLGSRETPLLPRIGLGPPRRPRVGLGLRETDSERRLSFVGLTARDIARRVGDGAFDKERRVGLGAFDSER